MGFSSQRSKHPQENKTQQYQKIQDLENFPNLENLEKFSNFKIKTSNSKLKTTSQTMNITRDIVITENTEEFPRRQSEELELSADTLTKGDETLPKEESAKEDEPGSSVQPDNPMTGENVETTHPEMVREIPFQVITERDTKALPVVILQQPRIESERPNPGLSFDIGEEAKTDMELLSNITVEEDIRGPSLKGSRRLSPPGMGETLKVRVKDNTDGEDKVRKTLDIPTEALAVRAKEKSKPKPRRPKLERVGPEASSGIARIPSTCPREDPFSTKGSRRCSPIAEERNQKSNWYLVTPRKTRQDKELSKESVSISRQTETDVSKIWVPLQRLKSRRKVNQERLLPTLEDFREEKRKTRPELQKKLTLNRGWSYPQDGRTRPGIEGTPEFGFSNALAMDQRAVQENLRKNTPSPEMKREDLVLVKFRQRAREKVADYFTRTNPIVEFILSLQQTMILTHGQAGVGDIFEQGGFERGVLSACHHITVMLIRNGLRSELRLPCEDGAPTWPSTITVLNWARKKEQETEQEKEEERAERRTQIRKVTERITTPMKSLRADRLRARARSQKWLSKANKERDETKNGKGVMHPFLA